MVHAFNCTPMGYHNPFIKSGVHAPFSVVGTDPDKMGGGILFWAYSEKERDSAVSAYKNAGFYNVRWEIADKS